MHDGVGDVLRRSLDLTGHCLAALRAFFDVLKLRHVILISPAHPVRGERIRVGEGLTPEITLPQARTLPASIDTSTLLGKRRDIPVRSDLERLLLDYLTASRVAVPASPLFRSASGKGDRLTENPTTGVDVCRLVKRRLKAAGFPAHLSPHIFRVAVARRYHWRTFSTCSGTAIPGRPSRTTDAPGKSRATLWRGSVYDSDNL